MSTQAASSKKMIFLRSSDGEIFEVEEAVALQSQTIKHIIMDNHGGDTSNSAVALPKVASKILAKVIEYCKGHVDAAAKANNANGGSDSTSADEAVDVDLEAFDADFVKVDYNTLLDLVEAAGHLKIKSLVDLTSSTVAKILEGMTVEEIRKNFSRLGDWLAEADKYMFGNWGSTSSIQ